MAKKIVENRVAYPVLLAAFFLVASVAGCSDDGGDSASSSSSVPSTMPSLSSTVPPTTDDPLADALRCENPDGFSISYPADWSVNDGTVVEPCSQFNPEPFEVPEGTDERVAAVTAYVDDVAFNDVVAVDGSIDGSQAVTVVDGHQAIRTTGETSGNQLYADGTPVTQYLIDMSIGVDDGLGTLFVDTIGFTDNYESHRTVLDAMVDTIDIESNADASVIARYEGGGAPIAVSAQSEEGEICLGLDVSDGRACVEPPTQQTLVRTVLLDGTQGSILAGVAHGDVFLIEFQRGDDAPFAVLPSSIRDVEDARAWAVPFGLEEAVEATWFDADGNQIGSRTLEPAPDEGPEPVGDPGVATVVSNDFPAGGPGAFLADVRVGVHDGFERVVFQFNSTDPVSYRVELTEEILAPSGEPLTIGGGSLIEVIMTPATGVDLSGEAPEIVYTGPKRISPSSASVIAEVVQSSDFENTLVWGLGVETDARFAVSLLNDPQRLVVDVFPSVS